MSKYATISIPKDIKKRLETAKGKHEWGEFLMELYDERTLLKSKRAFDQVVNLLTSDDLESMLTSSSEFREKFSLR